MQCLHCFFCAVVCLVSKSFARRLEVDESRGMADDASLSFVPDGIGIHGDFYIHNQCVFPINVMAQNGFVSPILHVQNQIAFGDNWHPPNKLQTTFTVSVGFEFEKGKEATYSLVKLGGIEGAKIVFSGSITAAAAVLTGTIGGGILVGAAGTALVGAGIVCPLCVAGGLSASFLTAYGFASGIQMAGEMVLETISDKSREFLRSRKRVMNEVPLYTFEGLMFPDDALAYAAVSETIVHWANHLQQTDRDNEGVTACSGQETAKKRAGDNDGLWQWLTKSSGGDNDCVKRYASRIYLPEGVAKIWVDTLNSKFSKSLWPAFHGAKHLYVRGGLTLPEYNEALDGWLVAAFTPIFLSEEERDKPNEESEFAACTQINPDMLHKFMSRCKKGCSKSAMGKDICEARCKDKLPSNSSGRGVCRGTYQSTRQMFGLGQWVCCAAGPQTEADAEERLAFPKFCLLNSDCKQPEEGNDKHEGKWACAEAEIPKTKFWVLDKGCWQAPVVADAGDNTTLLDKFPGGTSEVSWSDNDEIPWM